MRRSLTVIVISLLLGSVSNSQETTPRLAEQPILVTRFHGWTAMGMREYLQSLNDDLQIGSALLEQIDRPEAKENASALQNPVHGIMLYLTPGLIPSVEQVSFSEVADEAEFRKFVQIQKRQQGAGSVISGADDRYKVTLSRVVKEELPDQPVIEQTSASEIASSDVDSNAPVSVSVGIGSQGLLMTEVRTHSRDITENGKRYVVHTTHDETWYRFHDGFMFTAKTATLWDMPLPLPETLRGESDSGMNGVMAFYPDRIPMGLRQLAWGALSGAAGSVLQQHDDEDDDRYAVRQVSGAAGLTLVKAFLFDMQEISSWMKLATDEDVLRGEFRIDARKDSNLGRSLREFGMGDSRFAPILNDDSAATLHLNINLPDDCKQAVDAHRTYTLNSVAQSTRPATVLAAETVTRAVCSSADHGNVEFLVKIGWTPSSGAAVYGGLQFDQSPELLNAIMTLINGEVLSDSCASIQKGDLQMLQILIPREMCPEFLNLSHLILAHENSCLWFAMGGEDSHEIIQQAIAQCNDTAGLIHTPLLTANVDLQRWLAYPQDDPTGLTRLPVYGSMLLCELIGEEIGIELFEPDDFDGGLSSAFVSSAGYFLPTLRLRGSQELSLFVKAEESGLLVRGTVGSAVARASVAQCVVWIEGMLPTVMPAETEPAQ